PGRTARVLDAAGGLMHTRSPVYFVNDELSITVMYAVSLHDALPISIDVVPMGPVTDTLEVVEVIEDTPTEICGDTTMIPGDIASVDVCDPSNGTATVDGLTGCVLYTPNPGYIGTDELCIIVCDEDGTCDTTIVPIDVVPMGPVTDTLEIVEVIEDTPTERSEEHTSE